MTILMIPFDEEQKILLDWCRLADDIEWFYSVVDGSQFRKCFFFFFNCLMSKEADSSVYIYEAWAAGAGFLCMWLFHLGKSNQTPSENWCMMS